jgi:Permuted papain-like amidase enzyme, YaeF/YiiX, C92 family
MIHTYTINGLPLETGDILCTMNGKPDILPGEFWRLVGRLVPGDVDHVAVYVGPDGRCVEAGARGVITFEVSHDHWDSAKLIAQRGLIFDEFYGVAYPLSGLELSEEDETLMRERVAEYCLAQVGKPYNLNFLDPDREDIFYCSQLAYKAYLPLGINLNTGLAMERLPGTNQIIYPQEIWNGCSHRLAENIAGKLVAPSQLVSDRGGAGS